MVTATTSLGSFYSPPIELPQPPSKNLQRLHGEVINTRDVITFQGASVDELRREFEKSVDVYLDFCTKHGKEPDKPFSGKLVVRMKPELHRAIAIAARHEKKSLNALITEKLADDFGVIA